MGTTYYTSDLHFGHRSQAERRGFASVEEHDQYLIDAWNSQVTNKDTVWMLGDTGISKWDHVLDCFAHLKAKQIHLIVGNHDPVSPMHRSAYVKWFRAFLNQFETIQSFKRLRLNGHDVLLSHYPYMSVGDGAGRGPARYEQYRLQDFGIPLLHGHTHSTDKEEGPHQLHVGWDAWGRLVGQEEVIEWLNHQT